MRPVSVPSVMLAIVAVSGVGCSQQAHDQADQVGKETSQAAQKAGQDIKTDAGKVSVDASNDVESARIKEALNSASGLESKDIKVDTDVQGKSITLSGSVPTARQKSQAVAIAKGLGGPDFKVQDKLEVMSAEKPA